MVQPALVTTANGYADDDARPRDLGWQAVEDSADTSPLRPVRSAPGPDSSPQAVLTRGRRFRLPPNCATVTRLHVVTIGNGWCQLSELRPAQPLPAGVVLVDGKHRIQLPTPPGYEQRWATPRGEPVLALGRFDEKTAAHHVLLLALWRILQGSDSLHPPALYPSADVGRALSIDRLLAQ